MLVPMAVPAQAREALLVVIKPNLPPLTPSPPLQKRLPSLRSGPSSSREVLHPLQNWSFSFLMSTTTPQQTQTSTTTLIPSLAKGLVGSPGRLPVSDLHFWFHLLYGKLSSSLLLGKHVHSCPDLFISLFVNRNRRHGALM